MPFVFWKTNPIKRIEPKAGRRTGYAPGNTIFSIDKKCFTASPSAAQNGETDQQVLF